MAEGIGSEKAVRHIAIDGPFRVHDLGREAVDRANRLGHIDPDRIAPACDLRRLVEADGVLKKRASRQPGFLCKASQNSAPRAHRRYCR